MALTHAPIFELRVYKRATWRFAIGHPRSGEVARHEHYCSRAVDYVVHLPTGTIRRFG